VVLGGVGCGSEDDDKAVVPLWSLEMADGGRCAEKAWLCLAPMGSNARLQDRPSDRRLIGNNILLPPVYAADLPVAQENTSTCGCKELTPFIYQHLQIN
jgi:hypothetical protein